MVITDKHYYYITLYASLEMSSYGTLSIILPLAGPYKMELEMNEQEHNIIILL